MNFTQGLGFAFVAFFPLSLAILTAMIVLLAILVRRYRYWFIVGSGLILVAFVLEGCANTSDEPLTVINSSDPTGPLVPDHLDYGVLPR